MPPIVPSHFVLSGKDWILAHLTQDDRPGSASSASARRPSSEGTARSPTARAWRPASRSAAPRWTWRRAPSSRPQRAR